MKEKHKESNILQSAQRKSPGVPEAKTETAAAVALNTCVASCTKLCGKCGSSYMKLKLHKQICPGVNSFVTSSAGLECGRRYK